jgi:hypothetical protein
MYRKLELENLKDVVEVPELIPSLAMSVQDVDSERHGQTGRQSKLYLIVFYDQMIHTVRFDKDSTLG